jgi:hypothetical protein
LEIRNLKFECIIFLLTINFCSAQVIEYPLNDNPVIKEYNQRMLVNLSNHKAVVNARHSASADTLTLPFIDDFAQESIYPNTDLWLDSGAFINSTFCDNPPTVGVATFDGIDKFGRRYSTFSSRQYCDTLTSKPLRMAFAQSDTTVWLSFYYQPQGLGIAPFSADTLLLQFKDTANHWTRVWYKNGSTKQPFQRVNIHVNDLRYCYDGFQFRFLNYGPPNANTDHWNVDYVYMKNNRFDNDSITDVGLINKPTTILQEFTSMPWPHFSSVISLKPSVSDSARNINYGPTTIQYFYTIYDEFGGIVCSTSDNDGSSYSGKVSTFNHSLSGCTITHTSPDSALFILQDSLGANGVLNYNNDVSRNEQKFYNYYAYDDGSAELNAGIWGSNFKWAMQYDVKMRDTLRGVQIYFNPTPQDVSNRLIQIAVWDNVSVSSNSDHVLYKMINQYPKNIDSINGFATYVLDTPQVVGPGNIWVGFIQNDNILMGLGVDKNTDSHTKMFYSENGVWYQYPFSSSWMIRPFFGKHVSLIGVEEIVSDNSFEVYPVPSRDKIFFSFGDGNTDYHKLTYELSDITGRKVMEGHLPTNELDVSVLNSGIYFVRLGDEKKHSISKVKKIIVNR